MIFFEEYLAWTLQELALVIVEARDGDRACCSVVVERSFYFSIYQKINGNKNVK